MADAKPWVFTQLGGAQKKLTLAGKNAPHGRPRKSPVVEVEREIRQRARYYSGNDDPTRHVFGSKQSDWHLAGRFQDDYNGPQGARAKRDEVDAFVNDKQVVAVEWGGIVTATGLLTKFRASMESEDQIAWSLTLAVDSNDTQPVAKPQQPTSLASQLLADVLARFPAVQALANLPQDISYQPDLLTSIDNAISSVNDITGQIKDATESVDKAESAAFGEAERLRAGVHQLQNAIVSLQMTLDTGENDAALEASRARSEVAFYQARAEAYDAAVAMLASLGKLDREAERAQQGSTALTARAKGGDSWESLAANHLGGPSRADDLRQANKARYGQKPQPGRLVQIPKA